MTQPLVWPEGKRFAFTIFDDTDYAYRDNVAEVYALLADLGLRTTKSVWPLRGDGAPLCEGATCEDAEYVAWLQELAARGFEIAFHMATYHTSERTQTERGLDRFKELFGTYPRAMANHSGCLENIYWGDARLSGLRRTVYNLMTRYRFDGKCRGHIQGDPLWWGDLCRDRVDYVRNFVFGDINVLKQCPYMPYHDPERPYVKMWFAASEGPEVNSFVKCLSEANQERLEAEGGACIMYTHLACGFQEQGRLQPEFRRLMERLAKRDGWFAPVSALLDYLRQQHGDHVLTDRERSSLEWRWLRHKIRVGRS